jgi:hypothetical protein
MKLTRRDALFALAAGGIAVSATPEGGGTGGGKSTVTEDDVDTLVLLAEVLYPSTVEPTAEFVESYVSGRHNRDEDRVDGLRTALESVRQTSRRETGRDLSSIGVDLRSEVLRATGADRARPEPDGTTAEKIRYYVVNDLLYALYTSPTGGELVGNSNPAGHPGGTEAYQRAPTDE